MTTVIDINDSVKVNLEELVFTAIRAQGPGGQHVNKSSTAIMLQFDSMGSGLPERVQLAIKRCPDTRISSQGVITIKAQRYRSQDKNREDAIQRLEDLIRKAIQKKKFRVATKPSKSSVAKRLQKKKARGKNKLMRAKPSMND